MLSGQKPWNREQLQKREQMLNYEHDRLDLQALFVEAH